MSDLPRFRIAQDESTVTIVGETSLHPITVNVTPSGWLEARTVDGAFAEGTEIRGEVEIAVIEFRSGNPLVDRETHRRLRANQYPTIHGEVTDVVGIDGNRASVKGLVTFLGNDVELEGEVVITAGEDNTLTMTGEGKMDVQWWGLEPPTLLILKMEPVVSVSIQLVFRRLDPA